MTGPIWYGYAQGSSEWLRERIGCLTASRMGDAMAFLKNGKEADARKKLKIELIAERMTDTAVDHYVTDAMKWGIMQEHYAKERYEEVTGELVELCGFAIHASVPFFGASPDGLLGDDGLIEIKCPTTSTYMSWMVDGVVPEIHKPQMLAQLAVTQRKYCIFFAYDPRVKVAEKQHFMRRFEPTPADIEGVEKAAREFLAEVDAMFERVTKEDAP